MNLNMKEKNENNNQNSNEFPLIKYSINYYIDYYYNRRKYNNKSNIKGNNFFKLIENIVEFIFDKFNKWVTIVGPLFVNAFLCFFYLVYHSFLNNLIPYWSSTFSDFYPNKIYYYLFYLVICPIYTLLFFNVVLNYILTAIIKPGSIDDIKNSKKFRQKLNPYYCYKKLPNLNYILRMGNLNYKNKNKFNFCKYCKEIKPLRTHHCTVCRKCILRMDHHCPWVNNCIGLSNFRYFALFLFYLFFLCVLNTALSIYPFFSLKKFESNNELSFVTIICMCGIGISTFFNIWYWSLIINNKTSIEFWGSKILNKNWVIKSYSMKTIKENLYVTFCCTDIFKILFVPNFKSLDISGLEWSKIIDPSFEIKGIKNNIDLL